jgi:hypothetical protein
MLEDSMMNIVPIYQRPDGSYEVEGPLGRYHVGSIEDDPIGVIHTNDVEAYLAEHPEALIDEPKPPEPSAAEKKAHKDIDDESKELELDRQWIREQRKKAGK